MLFAYERPLCASSGHRPPLSTRETLFRHPGIFVAILVVDRQMPDLDDGEFQPRRRASSASALATFRLIESFLKLPTIRATLRILSIRFLFFDQ
jgi:hypothetical protein